MPHYLSPRVTTSPHLSRDISHYPQRILPPCTRCSPPSWIITWEISTGCIFWSPIAAYTLVYLRIGITTSMTCYSVWSLVILNTSLLVENLPHAIYCCCCYLVLVLSYYYWCCLIVIGVYNITIQYYSPMSLSECLVSAYHNYPPLLLLLILLFILTCSY